MSSQKMRGGGGGRGERGLEREAKQMPSKTQTVQTCPSFLVQNFSSAALTLTGTAPDNNN